VKDQTTNQGHKRRGAGYRHQNIFRKMAAKNFLNLEKEIVIQEQEACRTSNRQDHKRISPKHIIVLSVCI
jgi:hypothetical protein